MELCEKKMGMEETIATGPNFNRPVKDLVYKDLLTSTFTQISHDRGIKTWRASVSYPHCVFCGHKFRYETFNAECHTDPDIGKETIGKERTVATCKESLPTLEKKQLVRKGLLQLAKNHYQRRVVLIETVFWKCRQKSTHDQ